MHNKELVKDLLSIKDPETLMRRVHSLPATKVSVLMFDDEFVTYVGKIIRHNPEIVEKIEQENDRPDITKNNKLYNEGKISKEEFLDHVNNEKSNG